MKLKNQILIFCVLIQISLCTAFASPVEKQRPWVNILTWWGYLDDPRIKQHLENVCNTNISFDEYYTNEQFLDLYDKHSDTYDILIFSNLLYPTLKKDISHNESSLWKVSNNYYPYFKNKYKQGAYMTCPGILKPR